MISSEDLKKWEEHNKRYTKLIGEGIDKELVKPYDDELLSELRQVIYGGLPASIILLTDDLTNGFCLDRAPLVALGFGEDNYKIVKATIDDLRLNPYIKEEHGDDPSYCIHCYAERKAKDGKTWVYDTSMGLVIEKNYYYMLEKPMVIETKSKKDCLKEMEKILENSTDRSDMLFLPILIPCVEQFKPIQEFYKDDIKRELELYKEKINFEELCEKTLGIYKG